MRPRSVSLFVTCLLTVAPLAGQTVAQDDDDWEQIQVADSATTLALARYDSGLAIAVRCTGRDLSVMIQGLPHSTELNRTVDHEVVGIGEESGAWDNSADGRVAFSTAPRRHARALIGGGTLKLAIKDHENRPTRYQVELPSQSRGIKASLAACGLKPVDDRLPRRSDLFVPNSHPAWEWKRRVSPNFPSSSRSARGQARLLCQVRANGRLHNCELESESPAGQGFGPAVMQAVPAGLMVSVDPNFPLEEGAFVSFLTRFRLE